MPAAIGGVTPDAVGSLFDAAALFFEQAPWKKSGDRPIQVECHTFESGPWFAVVMGQGGVARGLVLYDNLKNLLRIQQGDLSEEDQNENDYSLENGFRLLSSYRTNAGDKLWIITEADRSATTLLLPEEY